MKTFGSSLHPDDQNLTYLSIEPKFIPSPMICSGVLYPFSFPSVFDLPTHLLSFSARSSLPESKDHASVCFLSEMATRYGSIQLFSPPDSTQPPFCVLDTLKRRCVLHCGSYSSPPPHCSCVSWRIGTSRGFFRSTDGTLVTRVCVGDLCGFSCI